MWPLVVQLVSQLMSTIATGIPNNAYFGPNAEEVEHVHDLKWKGFLTDPDHPRVEDAKKPVQVYPYVQYTPVGSSSLWRSWYNLTNGPYDITFSSSNPSRSHHPTRPYPSALLRTSLSSIPYASHINLTMNGRRVDLSPALPTAWDGSRDRRWVELPLPLGLPGGKIVISVGLTNEGLAAEGGQGGKMITSLEIMEYGDESK